MSQDNSQDGGQPTSPAPRKPPPFVPTLTHMVQPATPAKTESPPLTPAGMPAAFAELLKDWPALGEPAGMAEQASATATVDQDTEGQDAVTERRALLVAQRAEALVLQRLPALMAGLVSQAVRDAMAEVNADGG